MPRPLKTSLQLQNVDDHDSLLLEFTIQVYIGEHKLDSDRTCEDVDISCVYLLYRNISFSINDRVSAMLLYAFQFDCICLSGSTCRIRVF
ncbi:hypothetical protein V6N11_022971 [Hibiscus sabdariffa]|uniref:Uncharacterized protein n=1 Tax=Hibiscus sabdariffa TaxID=183260 RepID=A0ABR2TKV2_9ROSI